MDGYADGDVALVVMIWEYVTHDLSTGPESVELSER